MSNESTEIVEGFWVDFFGTASYVSMAALALYDYCITFDEEVEQVWKRRCNLSSIVFVINRYSNLYAVFAIIAFELFARTHFRLVCVWMFFSASVFFSVSQLAILTFVVIRTWAIWGRHFLPLVMLTPLALGVTALDAVNNLAHIYEGFSPMQSPYGGCLLIPSISNNGTFRCKAQYRSIHNRFLALCGTLAKTLMLKRAASQAGIERSLASLFIRDGAISLCATFILNVLQVVGYLTQSKEHMAGIWVLSGPSTWFMPIIISRMLLDLKTIDQVCTASLQNGSSSEVSSVGFIGNIGAPLDSQFTSGDGEASKITSRCNFSKPMGNHGCMIIRLPFVHISFSRN
ncbi:hypothetical protein ABKN59_005712 [Abortiporus biennis]